MRCSIQCPDEESNKETLAWMQSRGIIPAGKDVDLNDYRVIEIELIDPPKILEFFSYFEELSISKITDQGISFYLTNDSLDFGYLKKKRAITSEYRDGILFVPMSNVKAINSLGKLKRAWLLTGFQS